MSDIAEDGLRFIFAGRSIVSDWGNPAATTNRAVMTALIELGHEATYLEPRRDEALLALLKARGSQPMRAFLAAYPKLQYRTVDLPETFRASSWAGQFLSTASAAIALDGCPAVMADGIRQFEDAGVRFFSEQSDGASSVLTEGQDDRAVTHYQAAVLPKVWHEPRAGTVLVAYDDADLAREVAELVKPDARVVSGMAELPDWEWVAEVDLPERYGRAARVLVVDGRDANAPARVWLPRSNGAAAWGVVRHESQIQEEIAVTVAQLGEVWNLAESKLPAWHDARNVAEALVDAVRQPTSSSNGAVTASP